MSTINWHNFYTTDIHFKYEVHQTIKVFVKIGKE